jgi:hypothetical protein
MQKKECVKKKGTDNADRRDNRKRIEIESEGKRRRKKKKKKKKKKDDEEEKEESR